MNHRIVISKGAGDKRQFLSSDRGGYRWITNHEQCDDFEHDLVALNIIQELNKSERYSNSEIKVAYVFKSFSRRPPTTDAHEQD